MVYKIPLFHLQEIGQALLPLPGDAKSQPAPATATPVAATPTKAAPAAATPIPLSPYTNVSVRPCLVPNKSPTYKLKSEKSDLFCQTPTYKSPFFAWGPHL